MSAHEGVTMTELDETRSTDGVSRRTMLRGVTVGGVALPLLAACGGGGDSGSGSGGSSSSGGSSGSTGGSSGGSSGGSGATVAASDVPVGGGTILKAQKLVVTQPSKGDFKAFTAICTHQGCTVGQVTGGQIVCPCHGSHFSIKDGSPVSGPAQAPLASKKVSVSGGQISVT
jgi:nitrite reductase/ring-hydroxylating ferredoxin subunit